MEDTDDQPDRQTEQKRTNDEVVLENTLASCHATCETDKPEALELRHSDDERHGDDVRSDVFSDAFTVDIPPKSEPTSPRELSRKTSGGSSLSTPDGTRRHRPSVSFAADVETNPRKSSSHSSSRSNAKEAGSLSPEFSSLDRARTLSVSTDDMQLLPDATDSLAGSSITDIKPLYVDIIIATVLIMLYILSVIFNILVAVHHHDNHYTWFLVVLLLTIVPSLITQIASYVLGSKDEHSNDDTITILHILQLGVVSRYSRLLWKGIKLDRKTTASQSELLSVVCILHCFLSVAPQLVIQIYLMVNLHDASPTLIVSVCVQAITFAYCLAFHRLELQAETVLKLARLMAMFLWRFFTISSRVVAVAMFMDEFDVWIVLIFSIQIVVFVLAHVVYVKKNGGVFSFVDFLQTVLLGYAYLFCFFNHIEGQTRYRYLVYYSCIFLSNTMLVLFWYVDHTKDWYGHFALSVVWISFVLGLLAMLLYYRFLHHSKWENQPIVTSPVPSKQTVKQTKMFSEEERSRKETTL